MKQYRMLLPNGVRIVQEEVPYSRSVCFGLWMETGSAMEEKELSGISHFIEHMMFKGTKKKNAMQIAETIDRVGGELGAFTSREYTCFYTKVRDSYVDLAIELLAEMFFESLFEDEHIKKERKVIEEEIKMYEDTPDELVHDIFIQKIWNDHALGQPVLGSKEAIKRIGRKEINDFIRNKYSPSSMVLSFAGALKPEEILKSVDKLFGSYTQNTQPQRSESPVTRHIQWTQRRPLEQVHICIGAEALPYAHPKRHALYLLNAIMGGSMSSRLFQKIREERALAYAVYSYQVSFFSTGLFVVYIGTSAANYREAVNLVLEEFFNVKEKGVTEEELKKAKEQVKGNLVLKMEDTSNRMVRLAKLEIYFKEIFDLEKTLEEIDKVQKEDIKELSEEIFKKERIGIVSIGPIKKKDEGTIFL